MVAERGLADILLACESPLEDLALFNTTEASPALIIKDGKIYKNTVEQNGFILAAQNL